MKYTVVADILWYSGHVMTGFAIVVNHYHFYSGISFVVVGQLLTIVSRPIGRLPERDCETSGFFRQPINPRGDRTTVITI